MAEIIVRSFVTTAQGSHLQNNLKTYYCSYFDGVPYPQSDHDALGQPFVFNAPIPVEWLRDYPEKFCNYCPDFTFVKQPKNLLLSLIWLSSLSHK